mmetsp:Transcript_131112/g.261665  ORF Transcript_131112/g.261665 Transcript_131112/m.261665 type:complete len:211 (-) Transcript_131112:204-836(-)
MSRSRSRGDGRTNGDHDRIQRLVDERQQCRRDRDFDKADAMREELRSMGVNVNDAELSWRGPDGSGGTVTSSGGFGGIQRRDGDWDCPSCGKMVFASKDECFACGTSKFSGKGRRGHSDSRDRRCDRRSSRYDDRRRERSYDCYDDRRGDRNGDRYDDRRERYDRDIDRRDRYADRRDRYDSDRHDRYGDRYDDRRSSRCDDRRGYDYRH